MLNRNRDGMKYTKKFAKKIDYVSPVWVDLKSILIGTNSMKITVKKSLKKHISSMIFI